MAKVYFTEWFILLRKNTSVLGTINYTGFKKNQNSFKNLINKIATTQITNNWFKDKEKSYRVNTIKNRKTTYRSFKEKINSYQAYGEQ